MIHLTPPIEVILHGDIAEAKWLPATWPFKYNQAPLLVKNSGESDFPKLKGLIESANCPSWEAKFSSKFRARGKPLDKGTADEVIRVFEQQTASDRFNLYASTYVEALPYPPPNIDKNRQQTYLQLLSKLSESHEGEKCK